MDTIIFPVDIIPFVHEDGESTIYFPQVKGFIDLDVQQKINQRIVQTVQDLVEEQFTQQQAPYFTEMIGTFEIKTNERNILSLSFVNYAIRPQAAHGLTLMQSLTFDVNTGKQYDLEDLFQPDSNYVEILSELVKEQIESREIPILESFTTIKPNQFFYIADKVLVLYFQQYELSPYYVGLPMFPISVFQLTDIIDDDGPLALMATNN